TKRQPGLVHCSHARCLARRRFAVRPSPPAPAPAQISSATYCCSSEQSGDEMKLRVVCRKLYDYVRYDLKEIAFPSSLPDPPHIKKRPKLSWHDRWCILKEATRLYAASWVRDIGPDLRPNDYKKAVEEDKESPGSDGGGSSKKGAASGEPSVLEDLAVAARGGAETLKPALRRIYMARASTYTDAMKNFVETYQEGLKDQLQEKAGNGGEGGSQQQQQQEGSQATKPPPP
ncbi:hypothetical protein U9M48_041575, partial [Paspalum notatum var. saurae]